MRSRESVQKMRFRDQHEEESVKAEMKRGKGSSRRNLFGVEDNK